MIGVWRGFLAIRHVFGPGFAIAIVVVMALLLLALAFLKGSGACVIGLILLLLAIRAHDLKDLPIENEPTEVDASYDAKTPSFIGVDLGHSDTTHYRYNPPTHVLGRNHDGSEL